VDRPAGIADAFERLSEPPALRVQTRSLTAIHHAR